MQKKEEIIYFLPYSHGGVTSFVRNLLEYRPKSNVYYKVIQYREKELNLPDFQTSFNADEHIIFDYSGTENLYSVFKRLRKHISTNESYLVANDGLELRMAAALKLPNPVLYIVHGEFDYYYQLAEQNEPLIDKLVTVSEYLKNKYLSGLKKPKKIIKEYISVKNISKVLDKSGVLKLVFVGFLIEKKGVLLFADICRKLEEKNIRFEFNIIGTGNKLELLKVDFAHSDNVKITGQIPNNEVISNLCKSDLFLFPSYTEGMPVSVVEAMKCGCVPVVSDIPSGIPELVINAETGYKIRVGDTEGFANAIEKLANNPELRKKLSQNAKKHADCMFDANKQAEKYETLILSTTTQNKRFPKYPLGKMLNRPYLPNILVKAIRRIFKHPKI